MRASLASTTAATPAAVVVVATPAIFAATPGVTPLTSAVPAVATVAASLFRPGAFRELFLQGRPEDGIEGLVNILPIYYCCICHIATAAHHVGVSHTDMMMMLHAVAHAAAQGCSLFCVICTFTVVY